MSLRESLIQAVARVRTSRPEIAAAALGLVRASALPQGGFPDRAGRPDLYYTVFGLHVLASWNDPADTALLAHTGYLQTFGLGESLDFVHTACLARCWALEPAGSMPAGLPEAVVRRLEAFRSADGGFSTDAGAAIGTAYAAMLALGAHQDVGLAVPDTNALARSLEGLRTGDGFANVPGSSHPAAPATAAAVVTLVELGRTVPEEVCGWLTLAMEPGGGWLAGQGAPVPDLLSTATALDALAASGADLERIRPACLGFVDGLRSEGGGFLAHWLDDMADCEFTFYGLLALGQLTAGDNDTTTNRD